MMHLRLPTVLVHTTSLVLWAVVAFSATSWVLRGSGNDMASSLSTPQEERTLEADATATARSLGLVAAGPVAAPALASRFQLVGVIAGGPTQGAALIAVDGKPAKPFRVGAPVAEGLVLQSVQGRRVTLGAGGDAAATLMLELPARK
jgi:general secretion pathway protein C